MDENHRRAHDAFFVQIADRIGQAIIDGEIPVGSSLPREADLAIQHKVGRSAIREALKMLAAKGLIESWPRRGTVVQAGNAWNMFDPDIHGWLKRAPPTSVLIEELFEIRCAVEPAAAELAARRAEESTVERLDRAFTRLVEAGRGLVDLYEADVDFHRVIVEATGNRFFIALLPLISTGLYFNFRAMRSRRGGTGDDIEVRHRPLVEAIRARAPEAARAAMNSVLVELSARVGRPKGHAAEDPAPTYAKVGREPAG